MSDYPNGNRATEHWVEKVKFLQFENAEVRAALGKYGRHFGECLILRSPDWSKGTDAGTCTCGFDAATRGEGKP